jgi:hypothetical protein
MSWLHGSQLLAGVGVLALSALLLKVFSSTTESAAGRLGPLHLIVMPMVVLLIVTAGVALIFLGLGKL